MQPTAFIPCHCFAEKILKNWSSTVNIQLIIHNSTSCGNGSNNIEKWLICLVHDFTLFEWFIKRPHRCLPNSNCVFISQNSASQFFWYIIFHVITRNNVCVGCNGIYRTCGVLSISTKDRFWLLFCSRMRKKLQRFFRIYIRQSHFRGLNMHQTRLCVENVTWFTYGFVRKCEEITAFKILKRRIGTTIAFNWNISWKNGMYYISDAISWWNSHFLSYFPVCHFGRLFFPLRK